MSKGYVKIVLVTSLTGLILSFVLLTQHYRIQATGFGEKSFCSINDWIDCDAVNASSYSQLLSIPVAGFAFLFYGIILFSAIASLFSSTEQKGTLFFGHILARFAFLFTLYMIYVSFFELKLLCLLCAALYVVNILLVLLIPPALRIRFRDLPKTTLRYFKAAINHDHSLLGFEPKLKINLAVTVGVFLAGSLVLWQMGDVLAKKGGKFNPDKFLQMHFLQKPETIDGTGRPSWGRKGAPIVIAEFSDFQCPYCRLAAQNIKPALAEFRNDVVLTYFNYPLDMSCNPNIKHPMHEHACNAARAVLCANQKGKFWELHDLLFANQKRLRPSHLEKYAKFLGFDGPWFSECLFSAETTKALEDDIRAATALKISGTPSVFINGRKFAPWSNPKILRTVIKEELKRRKN